MKITIKKTETVEATPQFLADAFWALDDSEMREYFERLAEITKDGLFNTQIYDAAHNGRLSEDAKNVMRAIGDNVDFGKGSEPE